MIHPHTELQFISDEIGHGVVAIRKIPAGTITWVLDPLDREFSPRQYQELDELYREILDTYTYRNNKGHYVLCWDHGRFVNHSFNSNCLTTAYDFEIAIRDILPGEQLTDDYGYLNIETPFRGIDEGTDRKVVYPDDLLNYHNVWDEKLKKVFSKIISTPQPLQPFIGNSLWKKVHKIAGGEQEMDSILKNYYHPQTQHSR
jgi:uncharacterized protein